MLPPPFNLETCIQLTIAQRERSMAWGIGTPGHPKEPLCTVNMIRNLIGAIRPFGNEIMFGLYECR